MCISVVIQNGAIFCVIIDSKKFSTELTCRITVLFVEHRSNSSMVEPREILLTKARFILPVNAIPVLTSHGSRFQHSSTGANHSLRICDVKICIAIPKNKGISSYYWPKKYDRAISPLHNYTRVPCLILAWLCNPTKLHMWKVIFIYLTWQSSGSRSWIQNGPSRSRPPRLDGPACRIWTGLYHSWWCLLPAPRSEVSFPCEAHLRPMPRSHEAGHRAIGSWPKWPESSTCLCTSGKKNTKKN